MNTPNSSSPRWLVPGGTGFVGRSVIAHLKQISRPVMGTSLSSGSPFETLDIFDAEGVRSMLRKWQPTIFLNAVGHPPTLPSADLCHFYNRSTEIVLEAVQKEQPSCRVVLLGSAAEYGNSPDHGSSETDKLIPLSDYGRAKVAQFETACRFAQDGLDVITARLFNPIGPGQRSHLFAAALFQRIRLGEHPVRIHSGNHTRDWTDVRDVARALVVLAESPRPPDVVNICTGKGRTVEFVANLIGHLTGATMQIEPGNKSAGELRNSVGNPSRLFAPGWRPQCSLVQSLTDQWNY